jgi:hypothetical protein
MLIDGTGMICGLHNVVVRVDLPVVTDRGPETGCFQEKDKELSPLLRIGESKPGLALGHVLALPYSASGGKS